MILRDLKSLKNNGWKIQNWQRKVCNKKYLRFEKCCIPQKCVKRDVSVNFGLRYSLRFWSCSAAWQWQCVVCIKGSLRLVIAKCFNQFTHCHREILRAGIYSDSCSLCHWSKEFADKNTVTKNQELHICTCSWYGQALNYIHILIMYFGIMMMISL